MDSHTHPIASGHAYSTLHEMARAAADKGLELLGITEHAMAMPGTCHEYYFMNMRILPRTMYGIEIRHGAEVNIMDTDGRIDMDEYLLKPFDETLLLTRIQNILENRKRYQRKFTLDMDVDVLNMEEESGDKKFLNQVMEVIKENYKNSYFEVSDFCEAVGVSKSLLNKKLQNLIGQSAGQFIRNYRLNIARELILKNRETKNMNIAEVAYEVGFNDPKYFTRCFTKHFNVTPSALLNNEE